MSMKICQVIKTIYLTSLFINTRSISSNCNNRFRTMSCKRSIATYFKPLQPENSNNNSVHNKKTKITANDGDISAQTNIVDSEKEILADRQQTTESESEIEVLNSEIISTGNINITQFNTSILTELMNNLEDGWKSKLINEMKRPYFESLDKFLMKEITTYNHTKSNVSIFPPKQDMFSAFHLCPFDKVKVVIIGQDPYHGPSQAHGLCFSVRKGVQPPPSLKNIFTELKTDPDIKIKNPSHGCLESWAKQGVLLLNTCLSVRQGEPNSHQKQGWEDFTDAVVREIGLSKTGIVYLLWGKPAQNKISNIAALSKLKQWQSENHVITCSHPSPLGAYKTNEPFMNSRCFSRCNKYLAQQGKEPIDWNV